MLHSFTYFCWTPLFNQRLILMLNLIILKHLYTVQYFKNILNSNTQYQKLSPSLYDISKILKKVKQFGKSN